MSLSDRPPFTKAWVVIRMPRTSSMAVAEKWTAGACPPKVSSCTISAVWRWPVGLKDRTAPLRSGWCVERSARFPAAEEPIFPSM